MEYQDFMPPPPPVQPSSSDDIPPLKPNNWLWQSIVATILCCLPFGVVGIIYATKVDSLYYKGKYVESERMAQRAKTWTILSVIAALAYLVLWGILFATGNMPDYLKNFIEENASGYNF